MCGFVALLDPQCPAEAIEPRLLRMLSTLVHRGPDDHGTWVDGTVGLGFRRLSILDLSPAGHQPMTSADGDCTIVFNGEIYNYLELRKELQALGHVFRSSGDTEVLLTAYRQWGADCLPRLNGMWAFVIHDRARGRLFGSRDRFGIKPLYRWQDGGRLVLASEIKAIRASGLWKGGMNLRTCAAYLHDQRLDDSNQTFYDGIEQVPAGHAFEVDMAGRTREWAYWQLGDIVEEPHPDPAGAFAELFEDAMRLHMRSDVPVGVNLSGGLDSTAIICAAARLRAESGSGAELLAFCFQDKRFDESRYITDTLALTGARLVPLNVTPAALWDSLPRVLAFQDEPMHSMTALVGYQLMGLAASHGVKVVLNGQGADEVLGGYGSYFFDHWADLLRRGQLGQARREIAAFSQAHGGSARERFLRSARMALRQSMRHWPLVGGPSAARQQARARARRWLSPDLAAHLPPAPGPGIGLADVLGRAVGQAPLPLYLRVEDRNSMAHSIEVRLPFLDWRLVKLAFSLPASQKLNGPWNKYVLRESMRGRIPESVRSRVDKMGFPTDAAAWLRGPLYEPMRELIHDPGFRSNPLFDANRLAEDLEAHKTGSVNHTDRLFDAAQMHLWQKQAATS